MSNETEAGAIIIALRAQIENLERGMSKAKQTLQGFGQSAQGAAAVVQKSGERINQTFSSMERRSIAMGGRFARLTSGLLGFQGALSSLRSLSGEALGPMSKAFDAAAVGAGTFAAVVSVLPTKLGAVTGALAGATMALTSFLAPTREAIAAGVDAAKLTEGVDDALKTLERLTGQGRAVGVLLGDSPMERAKADIQAAKSAAEQLLAFQTRLLEQRKDLKQKLQAAEENTILGMNVDPKMVEGLKNQLAAVNRFLENVPERLEEIQKKLPGLKLAETIEASREAVSKLNAELQDTEKIVGMSLELGIVDPLSAAEQNARAAEKALQDLIARAAEFERTTGKKPVELLTAISAAKDKADKAREHANRVREVDRQAGNFSGAIGDAMFSGIMEGKKALEILSDAGRNLFGNFLADSVKVFQDGMNSAFKAITGVAGVELGGLITGLAGIAGGILAKREEKGSDSFSAIRSTIESSQAVRGIVAGPSSVAIASVADSLDREFAPIRERFDVLIGVCRSIEVNTRAGRRQAGGGGLGFAGTVPTT